jgi:stearoyl-CoA desaturase (delta-9 desaturase)
VATLIDWHITLYLLALPSLIYHFELNMFVNCSGHSWGYRNFDTTDESKNSKLVQYWTLGEGLHNNHHAHAQLYNFAVKKGESDISAWFIDKFLAIDGPQTQAGRMRID